MPLQPGTRLGNYEVLSDLGRGGMGEVYKARDLKLGREVAIKVLPQEMAADAQRVRRFEQEARAASALNHPNIVTIYEIGEHEGTPYIAMEFVDGVTLREMLAGGALPNDKLIRYATQMAEGLAKAHQAGIVHRDLKPENIVISDDGYVKILDFGLAKLAPKGVVGTEASTVARETTPGVILGTVGYMSPEQAKGEPADFRSDQFSLGAILYEMATGKRAFDRDSATQTLNAIIEDESEPITLVNPKVAATTVKVIDRCLSKDPAERYSSTWDIAKDIHWEELAVAAQPSRRYPFAAVGFVGVLAIILLMMFGLFVPDIREWVVREADAPRIESIAVLPLENLSGDPEQEYFADGMTDELISQLAQIQSLRVISRTSIMQYKDVRKPLPEIGRELDVDVVVEGTVRRADGRVRITAQLVVAADDRHLWAQSFEREMQDVLALQSEMARAIASHIQATLTPDEEERLAESRQVDPEAHEAYLKGRFHSEELTVEGVRKSVEFLKSAIDKDPRYGPAYARLAWVSVLQPMIRMASAEEGASKGKAMAKRALVLDDTLDEAHIAIALALATYDHDWSEAENSFRRGLMLNPNSAQGHSYYGWFLSWIGRHDEAIEHQKRALKLDPLSPSVAQRLGASLMAARRYDEAIETLKQAVALHPNYAFAYTRLGTAYGHMGMYEDAVNALERAVALNSGYGNVHLARVYALMGDRSRAHVLLAEVANETIPPAYGMARAYASLGENGEALEMLESAFEIGDPNVVLLRISTEFDPLRSDPRFQDLLRRMNFPEH